MSTLGGMTVLGSPAKVSSPTSKISDVVAEEKKDVVAVAVVNVDEQKKKKKKKKKTKKKKETGDEKKTITLTRFDKATQSHKQVSVPLVTVERSSSGTEDEDVSDEGLLGYRRGGYHPVNLDETYNQRYRVQYKLGWGQFSTVWLCLDRQMSRHVAVKFVKSASHYMEAARDEIEIMETLGSECPYLCSLLDHFDTHGPNGVHACLVFPVLGINLWDLLDLFAPAGVTLNCVRTISAQLLEGVSFMHGRGVIHTDLKPENLAVTTPAPAVARIMAALQGADKLALSEREYIENILKTNLFIKVVDFGNGCWVDKHFTDDIQTTQYRAPEVIIRSRYGPAVDVWSVACILFELLTGDQLFHPRASKKHSKDDDHVALIAELLGSWPRDFALGGNRSNDLFTRKGKVKKISKLEFWPLHRVLIEKYNHHTKDAEAFSAFLLKMLSIRPKDRATAYEMLSHPWLKDRIVEDSNVSPINPYDDKKSKSGEDEQDERDNDDESADD